MNKWIYLIIFCISFFLILITFQNSMDNVTLTKLILPISLTILCCSSMYLFLRKTIFNKNTQEKKIEQEFTPTD